MRVLRYLFIDLVLITLATLLALLLRDNFEIVPIRYVALMPYLALTLLAAAIVIPLLGIHRSIWRLSSMPDYLALLAATALIVLSAVAISFATTRLEGIARAIPPLQAVLILVLMLGARVGMRLRHASRASGATAALPVVSRSETTVLVVGVSRLTDTYLRAVREFAPGRVQVAGILGRDSRHVGRSFGAYEILGVPEQLDEVLRNQSVHGIIVDRIVVTTSRNRLSAVALEQLRRAATELGIPVEFVAEQLGLEPAVAPEREFGSAGTTFSNLTNRVGLVAVNDDAPLPRRFYHRLKRVIDFSAAVVLLLLALPLMAIAAIATVLNVGFPVAFWQQRPGQMGRPFKVYKFRTMASAFDSKGRSISEADRLSWIGSLMRRTRLDELPQLFNIVKGEMSFVGPRPLLPADHSDIESGRNLVRPGLTGWAQVMGGRLISADDKAVLDAWYVHNASLALDIKILALTIPMVLFGERVSQPAIDAAWRDLRSRTARDKEETADPPDERDRHVDASMVQAKAV